MLIQSKTQGVIDPPDVERDSGMVFTPLKRDSKTSLKIPPQQFLDRYMTLLMESFDSVNRDMFWTPSEYVLLSDGGSRGLAHHMQVGEKVQRNAKRVGIPRQVARLGQTDDTMGFSTAIRCWASVLCRSSAS